MSNKPHTRITMDIPTRDHKKLKMLAAFYGKSMRDVFVEILEKGLEDYVECSKDHVPNEITKKAIESVKIKKNLKKATSVEDLFNTLDK